MGSTTCSWCGAVVPTETLIKGMLCPKCNGDVRAADGFVPPSNSNNTEAPASPTTTPSTQGWFYSRDGQYRGPVTPAGLKQLAASNGLSPDDLVWREGMDDWVPAKRVQHLFPKPTQPPPPPESALQANEDATAADPASPEATFAPPHAAAQQSQSMIPSDLAEVSEQMKAGLWFYQKGDTTTCVWVASTKRPGTSGRF
ncbi:MAG: hypothetical protein CMJ64_22255 [Planctomycetaceae bacterium]|nr:hypothetical protein [Planctomycetaceae bacterium]